MRNVLLSIVGASLATTSAQSHDWRNQAMEVRTGTFIGARLSILGGTNGRANAALVIAPMQARASSAGMMRTRIGQGLAFNLDTGAKPTVTIAGTRADHALPMRSGGNVDGGQKLGVSKGVLIGVGVGVVLIGAAVLYLDSYCDRKISSICGDEE